MKFTVFRPYRCLYLLTVTAIGIYTFGWSVLWLLMFMAADLERD